MLKGVHEYKVWVSQHPEVEEWLRNRPEQTRRIFANRLRAFCEAMNVEPEEWRKLDKFKARDMAWDYVMPKIADHPTVAKADLVALKSWYRNRDGEQLPFDSGKGGKHYFRVKHEKRALEHTPSKKEIYQIVDMAGSLRDKALLLFLFQSGVRVNVLEHLTYGDVKEQLGNNIIVLKITDRLDHKLRSRDISFYYTFLNGEGAETLTRYCEVFHKKSSLDTPLFVTKGNKPVNQRWVWRIVKICLQRAGLNPKLTTTHTISKAFRKMVRQADGVESEFKEMVMGHVLSGSRENYFDRHDVSWFVKEYQKISFGREAVGSEAAKLKVEMEEKLKEKDLRTREEIDKLKTRLAQAHHKLDRWSEEAKQERKRRDDKEAELRLSMLKLRQQTEDMRQKSEAFDEIVEELRDPDKMEMFKRMLKGPIDSTLIDIQTLMQLPGGKEFFKEIVENVDKRLKDMQEKRLKP